MRILVLGVLLGLLATTGAWDTIFRSSRCYSTKSGLGDIVEYRMPLSIENFVALLEKYERQHSFANPDAVADAIIKRYKIDGISYHPAGGQGNQWQQQEAEEVDKQDILKKVLASSQIVPPDTFEPREECSLHFMTSHSTDIYPHPGLGSIWDGTYGGRYRRQAFGSSNYGSSNYGSSGFGSSNYGSSGFGSSNYGSQDTVGRYLLPSGVNPSEHPIENGVIRTPYGPVALGTLLAGIASSSNGNEASIQNIFGPNEVDYMPREMMSKTLNPQYISTLAGDIGQTALVAALSTTQNNEFLGPEGRFGNSSAAPIIFTLQKGSDGSIAYLSRAEVFAGIDAVLIQQALRSQSSRLKLSQIIRMYYSDRGLPNFPQYKACNRMDAYKQLNDEVKTKEQALNFMYAYSDYFADARRHIQENQDNFEIIQNYYTSAMNNAYNAFIGFVGSYGYTDYDRCPTYNRNQPMCENWSDLMVIYSREGGYLETQTQREYITHVAQMIGVSETRSRLGVMDGKSGNFILRMTNVSNIADWGANFTMDTQYNSGGSGSDMIRILDELRKYYFEFYRTMNSTAENATANSQVVVWNVPKSAPNFEDEQNKKVLREFHLDFPNVYFLLVGNSKGSYDPVLMDKEKDFFTMGSKTPEEFARTVAARVCQIPSVFVYPACDSLNVNFTNYNEQSHKFVSYVSPNFTTYAMIAPHNFRYSYRLKLKVETADVSVCASRKSMNLDSTVAREVECQDGAAEFEFLELCGRYLSECDPIYLSVAGSPTANQRCTDNYGCEFPNQIQYTISHDGMTCGAWCSTGSLLMMVLLALLHLFLY